MVLQQPSYFDLLQTDLTVNLAVLSIQRGGNDKNFSRIFLIIRVLGEFSFANGNNKFAAMRFMAT